MSMYRVFSCTVGRGCLLWPVHSLHKTLLVFALLHFVFQGQVGSVQFGSVSQSGLTLCDPMNCSMPGLPVYHQLSEFTQTHVHWVGDAIQPSHPLSSPSPPALNLSQHQDLFKWVRSLHQVAKVLEFQLQHIPRPYLPVISSISWLPTFAFQGALKSLLQHHSSKASILRRLL